MSNGVPKKGVPPRELPVAGKISPPEERPLEEKKPLTGPVGLPPAIEVPEARPKEKPPEEKRLPPAVPFPERPMEALPKEEVLEYPLITEKPRVSRLFVILGMAVLCGIIITFGIYIARKPEEIVPTEAAFEAPTITFLEEDKDKDGLTVLEEMKAGTNPENQDTDTDGIPDGWEVKYGLNPLEASDAMTDADEDDLTNLEEYNYKCDPLNPDTDGDGYADSDEVKRGYNPAGPGKLSERPSKEEAKPEVEGENIILIGAEGFSPLSLTVSKDDTVVWINQDKKAHQVMGGILDSGVLKPGHSWQYTFEEEGTYNYFDAFDIEMRGEVVVK